MTVSTLQELDITQYTPSTNNRHLRSELPPKQYHLKHRSTLFGEESYLNRFIGTDTFILENGHGNELYQTAFTPEEIGEMVKEFDVLFYFEMKEITDYD